MGGGGVPLGSDFQQKGEGGRREDENRDEGVGCLGGGERVWEWAGAGGSGGGRGQWPSGEQREMGVSEKGGRGRGRGVEAWGAGGSWGARKGGSFQTCVWIINIFNVYI